MAKRRRIRRIKRETEVVWVYTRDAVLKLPNDDFAKGLRKGMMLRVADRPIPGAREAQRWHR